MVQLVCSNKNTNITVLVLHNKVGRQVFKTQEIL